MGESKSIWYTGESKSIWYTGVLSSNFDIYDGTCICIFNNHIVMVEPFKLFVTIKKPSIALTLYYDLIMVIYRN